MPEQRVSVPVPTLEKNISALMLAILLIVLVIIARQYWQGGLSTLTMFAFALIWLLTAYKHLCRLLQPMIFLQKNQLTLQTKFGIERIQVDTVEQIRYTPHKKGWLNPKFGYFSIEAKNRRHPYFLVPRSNQNKHALMQFFSEQFPKQWQPEDPLVAGLRP